MEFGFKQPLVGEKRCVTTLITAAEETIRLAVADENKHDRLAG